MKNANYIEFYFDCSSPWTYFAFTEILTLSKRQSLEILWKPVLVGGIFNSVNKDVYEQRKKPNPLKLNYYNDDLNLWAKVRNIDLNLKGYDYYVQIPYHKSRLKARGYNVLDYLFDFLETKYSLKKIPLLTRKKSTKSLSLYKKLDRSIILDDIFELNPVHIKPNTKILLVDDIVTTQSTMKAALKILSDVSSIETISCLSIIKV